MTVLSYFCYLMTLWKIGAERASPFDHFELSGKINPFLHNIFIFVGVVVVIIAILYFSAGTKNIIHYIPICVHSFPFIFFYCRPTFVVLWSVCLAGGKASMGLELAWSVLCTLVSTLYFILWHRQYCVHWPGPGNEPLLYQTSQMKRGYNALIYNSLFPMTHEWSNKCQVFHFIYESLNNN